MLRIIESSSASFEPPVRGKNTNYPCYMRSLLEPGNKRPNGENGPGRDELDMRLGARTSKAGLLPSHGTVQRRTQEATLFRGRRRLLATSRGLCCTRGSATEQS